MEITAETLCPQVSPQDPPPSPEVVTPAEILRRAAYRVGQPGAWCQGTMKITRGDTVSYCLLGAIQAETGNKIFGISPKGLAYALTRVIQVCSWITWNDKPERTQGEVVSALIRTSELLEAETAAQ